MPAPVTERVRSRAAGALAGLAGLACVACCLLPALIGAGVVGASVCSQQPAPAAGQRGSP